MRLWLEPESLELAIQAMNHSQGALLFDGAGEPIGRLLPLVQEGQQAVEVNLLPHAIQALSKPSGGSAATRWQELYGSLLVGEASSHQRWPIGLNQEEPTTSRLQPLLKNVDFEVRALLNLRTNRLGLLFKAISNDWIPAFVEANGVDTRNTPVQLGFTFGRDGNYRFSMTSGDQALQLRTWHPMSPVMRDDVEEIYKLLGDRIKTLSFRSDVIQEPTDTITFWLTHQAMDRDAWIYWRALISEESEIMDSMDSVMDLNKSYQHDGDIFLSTGRLLELGEASPARGSAGTHALESVRCFALARTSIRSSENRLVFWSGGEAEANFRICLKGTDFGIINPDQLRSEQIDSITGVVNSMTVNTSWGEQLKIRPGSATSDQAPARTDSSPITVGGDEPWALHAFLNAYQQTAAQRGSLGEALTLLGIDGGAHLNTT